ncbi:TetR family transcriptional regulator [Kushneria sinocarnis]|uniref:TetR family transcriptional regulator n=1 Tax=Kushneria sinocarnis TaxID=595502 RepID=A0A420X195_9GAMM|nr:TetR/AcrR family transcriptional regulator [Kushneria sinocarnis]RKR07520.1 TetR family transcriptional regulator [Kushneria sinocarnis]
MSTKSAARPGGRSARVQQAVHEAVRGLDGELARERLTVPLIAERAGVTPSTIYRRWGCLRELLADVAAQRLQPEAPLAQTGSLAGDLFAWTQEYMEEMTSTPGRQVLADVLGSTHQERRTRCWQWQRDQLSLLLERAASRGEAPLPGVEQLLDGVMAPLIYRLSYAPHTLDEARLRHWIRQTLDEAVAAPSAARGET